MKSKFLWLAMLASAALIAQAKAGGFRDAAGGVHAGAVAHTAARPAPARTGGFSSMHSMPTRSFGGRMINPSQRYSAFAMRPSRPAVFRRPNMYPSRVTYTRSGPFTAATINQANRFPEFANHRNQPATNVWNQRNSGSQFRNGNNHLRADWQKHVFAQRSGDWHRDWDRHTDHWWNGHRCHFFNGSWVIFDFGFYPWWPYWSYPDDYYAYGSPYSGYDYPYSYDYNPGYYDSGDYQGQMYYDQNSYPDQSQSYYDSSVYQTGAYYDQPRYSDESNNSTIVAAQERLAREGYYRGETDGVLSPEMQKAVKHYQSTNGLRATGYLDTETLAVMGLRKSPSY
jgi:putative peptidoglycan binding protein